MLLTLPAYARDLVLPEVVRDPAACLGATDVIEPDHPSVVRFVAERGREPRALFEAVRDQVRYDLTPSLRDRAAWRASATLERGTGFCQQKAVLLASALRHVGVPAAIDFQHIRDHKLLGPRFHKTLPGGIIAFHGRIQAFLGGAWKILDPTLEVALCTSRGYRVVTFEVGVLPTTDLAGGPHFDELGRAGPFADLPVAVSDVAISLGALWRDLAAVKGASM